MYFMSGRKFLVMFAWEIVALTAMVYLFFFAACKHVAATLKKAIIVAIPATITQWAFFHHRLSAFILPNPSPTPIPLDYKLCRIQILIHCDFIGSTLVAINATSSHFQLAHT